MGNIMSVEQRDLVEMVRNFAIKEVKPHVKEFDETGEFPLELLKQAFEMGLHCLEIPEKYGGSGLDYKTTAMVFEELAKVDAGYAISLVTTFVALRSVIAAGNEEQIKLFSDIIIPGAFAGFCLTEPNSGSDASAMRGTAVKDGDDYIINATKCFVTNGGVADVFVVFASTDKSKGVKGISAFIVERSRAGITVGKHEDKMGLRLSNTTDVAFVDVRVPADHLLGKEGSGFTTAMNTLNVSRAFVGALAVGICQSAIDEAVKYNCNRFSIASTDDTNDYVTTNLRVIVENKWMDDLKFITNPTANHEIRITVHFTTQVGITREFNRHRANSMAEQSTRYCNYTKDKFGSEISVNVPKWVEDDSDFANLPSQTDMELFKKLCKEIATEDNTSWNAIDNWLFANLAAEFSYMNLISMGKKPQEARVVLPLDINTELVHTAFLRDWKHFFDLRAIGTTGEPHPDAKAIAAPLYNEFKNIGLIK